MERVVANSECPLFCRKFSREVDESIEIFSQDAANDDTLKIDCPDPECTLAFEKYVFISSYDGTRMIREGMYVGLCKLSLINIELKKLTNK